MNKTIERNFYLLLIFLIVGCNSQPMTETQQIASTPPLTPQPTATLPPTPHPLAITVQNASSLKLQKTIGAGMVNDVAWSPQGDVIAIAQDFEILFYDSSSLQLIDSIDLWGNQIAFSPDGLFLAIAYNNYITIWDINKKEIIQELAIKTARIESIIYNSDGTHLAVLSTSSLSEGDAYLDLVLWSVESWEKIIAIREIIGGYISFSPDGKTLAFASGFGLTFIQVATGKQQGNVLPFSVGSLAYLSDQYLLKRIDSDQLGIIDLTSFQNSSVLSVNNGLYSDFRVGSDKSKVVFPEVWDDNEKRYVTQVWDVDTKTLNYTLEYASDAEKIDFSPNGKYFISTSKDGFLRIYDIDTGSVVKQLEFTAQVDDVEFISEEILAGGYFFSQIRLWNIDSSEIVRSFEGINDWGNIISINTNRRIIATKQDYSSGKIWEIETGLMIASITCPEKMELKSIVFSGENDVLFECGNSYDNSMVIFFDLISKEQSLLMHGSLLENASMINGPIVVQDASVRSSFSVSDIPGIKVVNTKDGNILFDIAFDEDFYYMSISEIKVSSDSKKLALLIGNSAALIWEVGNKEYQYSLQGHYSDFPYKISDIAFSPYGYLLVSAGYDNTVRMWDVTTGEQLAVLDDFANNVNAVAFSPDGRYLIAGCDDGRIYVYVIE